MAFRDNRVAHRERELAELQTERDRLRADRNFFIRENRELQDKLKNRPKRESWLAQFFARRRAKRQKKHSFSWFRFPSFPRVDLHNTIALVLIVGLAGFLGLVVQKYFTDIQEGVVTSKNYSPEHEVCTTNAQGFMTCTTYSESWSVDIAYQGETARWTVSEDDFNRLDRGEWYCYTDHFHPQSDCHGEPEEVEVDK